MGCGEGRVRAADWGDRDRGWDTGTVAKAAWALRIGQTSEAPQEPACFRLFDMDSAGAHCLWPPSHLPNLNFL